MADIADKGNEAAEVFLSAALKNARSGDTISTPTGECLFCKAEVAARRWCDPECRDLWEAEQR